MRPITGLIAAALITGVSAGATRAEDAVFDVYLRGIKGGSLTVKANVSPTQYAASGLVQTTGLVGKIAKFRYTANVRGKTTNAGLSPLSYSETEHTSRRTSTSTIDYQSGTPVVTDGKDRKPRDYDIDPAKQGDTVDPLTAIYLTVRAVPEDQVCALSTFVFDGHRRSKVTLSSRIKTEAGYQCKGEYRRVAGYKPKDMQERTSFPFTVDFVPTEDGKFHGEKISSASLYGTVVMNRR
ncbi:MAG: DUF3108 domain-containing protein [Pseudoruegeria sp.]